MKYLKTEPSFVFYFCCHEALLISLNYFDKAERFLASDQFSKLNSANQTNIIRSKNSLPKSLMKQFSFDQNTQITITLALLISCLFYEFFLRDTQFDIINLKKTIFVKLILLKRFSFHN